MPFSSIIDDGDIVTEFMANPGGAAAKAAETDDRYRFGLESDRVRVSMSTPFRSPRGYGLCLLARSCRSYHGTGVPRIGN